MGRIFCKAEHETYRKFCWVDVYGIKVLSQHKSYQPIIVRDPLYLVGMAKILILK